MKKSLIKYIISALFIIIPNYALAEFPADSRVWVYWASWDSVKSLGTFDTRDSACSAFGPFFLRVGLSKDYSVTAHNNESQQVCEVVSTHINGTKTIYKLSYGYFYTCPQGSIEYLGRCYCQEGKHEFGRSCLEPNINFENSCRADGIILGNPIIPATGEKYRNEVDWRGSGPDPIELIRTYRSKIDYYKNRAIPVLGPGWGHNYDIEITTTGNDRDQVAFISTPYEQIEAFRSLDDGESWEPLNGKSTLSKTSGKWIYTVDSDKSVWTFNSTGKIESKLQINGWNTTYLYYPNNQLKEARSSFGAIIKFYYNSANQLERISPPDGFDFNYGYDDLGRLVSVTYPGEVSRKFLYEVPGNNFLLTGIIDENSKRIGYFTFDANGRVTSSELTGGVERYSVKYPQNNFAIITDPLNTTRTYGYSFKSAQLAVIYASTPSANGDNSVATRSQDNFGLIESEKDFRGIIKRWVWDTNRRLPLIITEAYGAATNRTKTTEWHPQWPLPVKVIESKREITYTHDNMGNTLTQTVKDTSVTPAQWRTWIWTYHPSGLMATETEPNGAVTSFVYDSFGNLIQQTNPLGHIDTYTYDSTGRVLTHKAPTGLVSSYQYDLRGRLTRTQRGEHVSLYTYNLTGQVATVSTPVGYQVSFTYDAAHRLTGWSDNRGAHATYTLDNMGNRVNENITDAQSQVAWNVARTINGMNRVDSITVGSAATGTPDTTGYGYDANGDFIRSTKTVGGTSHNTTQGLDALRRVNSITNAQNATSTLVYDAQNAITQATDFKSVRTNYTRDALGNAKQEVTPDSGTVTTTYDSLGLPQQITDALGRASTITRDALGRPTRIEHTGGSASVLRYDLLGTDYNAPGAPNASIGFLSEIQDPGVTTRYQRDLLGRVVRKTQTLANGDIRSIAYGYIAAGLPGAGQIASITYPSGKQLVHQYDATGQLTGLTWAGQPLITSLTWNPLGQPNAWQWAGFASSPGSNAPMAEQRSYTSAGQLAHSALLDLTWDSAGRISQILQQHMLPGAAQAQQATITSAYTYDPTGRLTASAHSGPAGLTLPSGWSLNDTLGPDATGYAWDNNGNRTQVFYSATTLAGTATMQRNYQTTSGSNRLQGYSESVQIPGSAVQNRNVTYSHNAAGALTKKGDNYLHYGADARIAKASLNADPANALAVGYTYNAMGQRLLKSDARLSGSNYTHITQQTLYAEDGIGSTVLGQYGNRRSASSAAPAGEPDSTEVIYLPTASGPMPIAAQINGRLYAIDSDHLNTPRRLTNQQGQVAWQWLITGFGETAPTKAAQGYAQPGISSANSYAEAVSFELRYPGQQWDEETGLSYNLHRYYDAVTGRYTQADPIGLEGGWNRFSYVQGNPLSLVDPKGLKMFPNDFVGPLPLDGYYESQMTKTRCGLVPPSPPGTDIFGNMRSAKDSVNPLWFRDMVKNKGPWDFKQKGPMYQDFGNFHYGAVGSAFGFYQQTLLQEAGRAQQAASTSRPEWGYPPNSRLDIYGGKPPYGDDPDDQGQITNGIDFCRCMGY